MPSSPEAMLISSVVENDDYAVAMGENVTTEMFRTYENEWQFLTDYYSKYRHMPTRTAFRNKFPDFRWVSRLNDTGHMCEEVKKAFTRHRLMESIKDCTDYIAGGDIDAAAKLMHSSIISITADVGGSSDIDIISDWEKMLAEAKVKAKAVDAGGFAGIPSGFETLDDLTGGAQPGEFHVVAARLGEFKSWFMQRWAAAALVSGKTVQYNSLEMSPTQVGFRMHAILSGSMGMELFSNLDLQQGRNFNEEAYRKFLRRLRATLKGGMFTSDGRRGRISPLTIASQIERNQPDIVFIDYITLMEGAIGGDWKSIGQLTGELKQLAQQYQVPIIGAAQLNRTAAGGKGPASAETIAQSDSIGQDADSVVTLKKLSDSVFVGMLAKNRHGPNNVKFHVDFRPNDGVFNEVSHAEAMARKDIDIMEAEAREQEGMLHKPRSRRPVQQSAAKPVKRMGNGGSERHMKKRPRPARTPSRVGR